MTTANDHAGCHPPVRSRQYGTFNLPLPPSEAFELFTAEGERRWVNGWNPVILSGGSGDEPGAVFLTDHGGEETVWTVIAADREASRLIYSRVSPGRRAGIVCVAIAPAGVGSDVTVSYDVTALGPAGEVAVRAMDESGFATMLDEWRRLILANLG